MRPWVSKWWDLANDRRQRLVVKNARAAFGEGPDLTEEEGAEFWMLQRVADLVVSYEEKAFRARRKARKAGKVQGDK